MSQECNHYPSGPESEFAQILADLAVLAESPGVNLHVSFERGLITIRSEDRILWSSGLERPWAVVDGPARAKLVVKWLHDAAEKHRESQKPEATESEEAA